MNEKIPQHVILDLLPLYLADEVSDETRTLIEEYLKTDPNNWQLLPNRQSMHQLCRRYLRQSQRRLKWNL